MYTIYKTPPKSEKLKLKADHKSSKICAFLVLNNKFCGGYCTGTPFRSYGNLKCSIKNSEHGTQHNALSTKTIQSIQIKGHKMV